MIFSLRFESLEITCPFVFSDMHHSHANIDPTHSDSLADFSPCTSSPYIVLLPILLYLFSFHSTVEFSPSVSFLPFLSL